MSRQVDHAWSDQFLLRVAEIVGPYLLVPASSEADMREVADLVVPRFRQAVAVRLRRRAGNYPPSHFTLRLRKRSGARTELAKIVDRHGDLMFYGHADHTTIDPWLLIDLHALRAVFMRYPELLHSLRRKHTNDNSDVIGKLDSGDGGLFVWIDVDKLPDNVLLARSPPVQAELALTA
jgi:hypothetical protein